MDESTDVDRMLARLGETTIQYREFSDPIVRTTRPWDLTQPLPPVEPVNAVAYEPVSPVGNWNTGATSAPRLTSEALIPDPEAPGGRLAAVHAAEQHSLPILDAEADGRTPPAGLNAEAETGAQPYAAPEPTPSYSNAMPYVDPPATPAAPAYVNSPLTPVAPPPAPQPVVAAPAAPARPAGNLDSLFKRVSNPGTPAQPPAAGTAPLSSVFKRLS